MKHKLHVFNNKQMRSAVYTQKYRRPTVNTFYIEYKSVVGYNVPQSHGSLDRSFSMCQFLMKTRGHSLKLVHPRCHYNLRKYSFTVRIVNLWNSLPENVVLANTVNTFKNSR